jgi:hypothetical protein
MRHELAVRVNPHPAKGKISMETRESRRLFGKRYSMQRNGQAKKDKNAFITVFHVLLQIKKNPLKKPFRLLSDSPKIVLTSCDCSRG